METNRLTDTEYAEPYAGGAAVALALLFEGRTSTIHLNDLSRPIFAFWHTVLNDTDALCDRVKSVSVTMDEWHRQRAIYDGSHSADLRDLGFATFFLNRTNRSGIIAGGVIGGKRQTGHYTMDVRFGKENLVRRIAKIGRYRSQIHLYNMDALDFTRRVIPTLPSDTFVFFDPPYIERGKDLYLNDYDTDAHLRMSRRVQELGQPWICTYDRPAIKHGLYPHYRRIEYGLPYTAQGKHEGQEVMFLSHCLALPEEWTSPGRLFRLTPPECRYGLYGIFEDHPTN